MKNYSVWTCTVVGEQSSLVKGSDLIMRGAVVRAFQSTTGWEPQHIFSGWGNPIPEKYLAVIENRLPDPEVIRKELQDELNVLPTSEKEELTVQDALSLISQCAQSCRESGESDMRNILNAVRSIESDIAKGLSRDEILDSWQEEDDE